MASESKGLAMDVAPSTLKKVTTGYGGSGKDKMVRSAHYIIKRNCNGVAVTKAGCVRCKMTLDEADAICLLNHASATTGGPTRC